MSKENVQANLDFELLGLEIFTELVKLDSITRLIPCLEYHPEGYMGSLEDYFESKINSFGSTSMPPYEEEQNKADSMNLTLFDYRILSMSRILNMIDKFNKSIYENSSINNIFNLETYTGSPISLFKAVIKENITFLTLKTYFERNVILLEEAITNKEIDFNMFMDLFNFENFWIDSHNDIPNLKKYLFENVAVINREDSLLINAKKLYLINEIGLMYKKNV